MKELGVTEGEERWSDLKGKWKEFTIIWRLTQLLLDGCWRGGQLWEYPTTKEADFVAINHTHNV
jgi:glutamine synthetase